MALDNCRGSIENALGRPLTKREEGIVQRKAIELNSRIAAVGTDPGAIKSVLQKFADDITFQNAVSKRNAALNWRAFSSLKSWRQAVGDKVGNPGEVLKALTRGSLFNFFGSKDSLAALAVKESNSRVGAFLADLENKKLTDYAFSGSDDKNIVSAQHDLRNGVAPDPAKYGKNAVDLATIIEKHQEALRVDQNGVGAWIAKNSDRLFRRTHDAMKIARAGDNTWGSDASKAAWTKHVSDRMDWDKAFDGEFQGADAAARQKRLESLFTQFTADKHLTFEPPSPAGVGAQNFGRKVSYGRELVFKSPQADLEYQRSFGRGSSVSENIWHNLSTGGRDLAIMRRMGPNPRQTLDNFVDDWSKELTANGDAKGAKQLDARYQAVLKNDWRLLTENTGHPASNFAGRFVSSVRHTTNTAALGMSIFSVPGDLALRASMMAQAGGGSAFAELARATTRQFTGIGLSKEAVRNLAAEGGIRMEGAHLPLDPNMVDHVGFGQVAKWNQMVMRATGHSWWTNRIRTNSLAADAFRHWTYRDTAYDGLPAGMRDTLKQFGITDKAWDVLRGSDAEKLDNGMSAFLPSNIKDVDPEKFRGVAGADATQPQLLRARQTLMENYRNLLGEMADRSTSSPSITNRAFMGMGLTDAGTWQGELMRGALQLKGFLMNYMRNHLGREIYGYSEQYRSLPQIMADTMKGKNPKAVAGLAKLISGGVGISFITNALRDMATGKTPEDPTTGHAVARAFARQSFGLYSDFLFKQGQPNESFWEKLGGMTGPEFGLLSDAANQSSRIADQVMSKDGMSEKQLDGDSQKLFGTAYRNTPGTNLFWDKWAMDYMVLNNISEHLNPGYKQRLMDNAAKHGQRYMLGAPSP